MKKKIIFVVLLIIFIILFLVFVPKFIWGDEAWSGKIASMGFKSSLYYSFNDFHPPLYHLILSLLFYIFPDSWIVGRIFSLLLGILLIYIILFHLNRFIGEEESVLLSIVLTFSPFFLYIFTLVRMYSLAVLLSLLSIYSFFALLRGENLSILFVISNLSMLLTHHFTLPLFLLEGLFFLIKKLRKGFKVFLITLILYLPFTYILLVQLKRRLTLSRGWGNILSASFFKDTFSFLFFNSKDATLFLIIPFIILILFPFFRLKSDEDKFFASYFILYLSMFFILSLITGSIFFHYISLLIIPSYYLLVKGIMFFDKLKEKLLVFVLIALISFVPFSFLKAYPDVKELKREIEGKRVVFLNRYEEFRHTFGIKGDFLFLRDLPLNNFTFDRTKKIREGIEKLEELKRNESFIFVYTGVGSNLLSIYDPKGKIKRWLEENSTLKKELDMFTPSPIFIYYFFSRNVKWWLTKL